MSKQFAIIHEKKNPYIIFIRFNDAKFFYFLICNYTQYLIRETLNLEFLIYRELKRISDFRAKFRAIAYKAQNEVSRVIYERFHIMRHTRIAPRDKRNIYTYRKYQYA